MVNESETTVELTMQTNIESLPHLQSVTQQNGGLVYFSQLDCNVCTVLKPKVIGLLEDQFPQLPFYYVDCKKLPDAAAQFQVFAIPTIKLFFLGREQNNFTRSFSLDQLSAAIDRYYRHVFADD